jgi:hypothetical protein
VKQLADTLTHLDSACGLGLWTSGLAWKNDPIHRERWGSWWLSGCLFYSNDGLFNELDYIIIGVCDRDGSNMIPHSRGYASIKTTHSRCFFSKKTHISSICCSIVMFTKITGLGPIIPSHLFVRSEDGDFHLGLKSPWWRIENMSITYIYICILT